MSLWLRQFVCFMEALRPSSLGTEKHAVLAMKNTNEYIGKGSVGPIVYSRLQSGNAEVQLPEPRRISEVRRVKRDSVGQPC